MSTLSNNKAVETSLSKPTYDGGRRRKLLDDLSLAFSALSLASDLSSSLRYSSSRVTKKRVSVLRRLYRASITTLENAVLIDETFFSSSSSLSSSSQRPSGGDVRRTRFHRERGRILERIDSAQSELSDLDLHDDSSTSTPPGERATNDDDDDDKDYDLARLLIEELHAALSRFERIARARVATTTPFSSSSITPRNNENSADNDLRRGDHCSPSSSYNSHPKTQTSEKKNAFPTQTNEQRRSRTPRPFSASTKGTTTGWPRRRRGAHTTAKTSHHNHNHQNHHKHHQNHYDHDELEDRVVAELLHDDPVEVRWDDVVGLRDAKAAIQESVVLPFLRPDLYTGLRRPPKGILLYGPPGTGKTMLARAAACESGLTFFACSASGLTSKWVGESEKLMRSLFRAARRMGPSIVFLDELDSVLSARTGGGDGGGKNAEHEASRRLKTEFLVQTDGVVQRDDGGGDDHQQRVLVLGCSNRPWDLDEAVLRRFERRVHVPLPDRDGRSAHVRAMLRAEEHHALTEEDVERLVRLTDGLSCSDMTALGREAAFGPLRELGGVEEIRGASRDDLRPVVLDDFERALSASDRRSVSAAALRRYETWERRGAGNGGGGVGGGVRDDKYYVFNDGVG